MEKNVPTSKSKDGAAVFDLKYGPTLKHRHNAHTHHSMRTRKWQSFKEVTVIAQEEIEDFKLVLGNIGIGIG